MALSRAELRTAVAGELAQALTLAGLATTDTSGALKEPLDRTFRQLGAAETGLAAASVADGSEAKAIAYAVFFTLDRIVAALLSKMDVSGGGSGGAKLNQQIENAERQRARALSTAITYGLPDFSRRVRVVGITGGGLDIDPFFDRDDFAVFARGDTEELLR